MANCEFFLLRYVPDLVKNEAVNVGLVLMESGRPGFAGVRFAQDLSRVQCLDAGADLEALRGLEEDLRARLASAADFDEMLKLMQTSFSNTIQLSSPQACQTEAPQQEMERLAQMYLEPSPRSSGPRELPSRGVRFIRHRMQEEFSAQGVWELMFKGLSAARYTHRGDPLKIDCGYRVNGGMKMFHAVSLQGDLDSAKALALSYPRMAEGIARLENAEARLTALVEDDASRESDQAKFAFDTFQQANIAVAGVSHLADLAAAARRDLRL